MLFSILLFLFDVVLVDWFRLVRWMVVLFWLWLFVIIAIGGARMCDVRANHRWWKNCCIRIVWQRTSNWFRQIHEQPERKIQQDPKMTTNVYTYSNHQDERNQFDREIAETQLMMGDVPKKCTSQQHRRRKEKCHLMKWKKNKNIQRTYASNVG